MLAEVPLTAEEEEGEVVALMEDWVSPRVWWWWGWWWLWDPLLVSDP